MFFDRAYYFVASCGGLLAFQGGVYISNSFRPRGVGFLVRIERFVVRFLRFVLGVGVVRACGVWFVVSVSRAIGGDSCVVSRLVFLLRKGLRFCRSLYLSPSWANVVCGANHSLGV